MSYQINFHSFLVAKDLRQDEVAKLQSPELQAALHDALLAAFEKAEPELADRVQVGLGRVEVSYLGL